MSESSNEVDLKIVNERINDSSRLVASIATAAFELYSIIKKSMEKESK